MNKILQFIVKHNMKITIAGFLFPIILQLKSIIAPPLIALYDKVPSLSQTYDSILSIRNPFHKKHTSLNHETIELIIATHKDKNLSRESIINLRFILKELFKLQEKSKDKEYYEQAITEMEKFSFITSKQIFNQQTTLTTKLKEKAKYTGFNAILTSFTNKTEAVSLYNTALSMDPDNLFILNNMGQLYLESKNYSDAKIIYNKIIKISKKSKKKPAIKSLGYSNLGVINLAESNYMSALKFFNKALNINKKYQLNLGMATQYTNIALTYEKLNKIEKACVNYRRARIIFYRHYQDDQADRIMEKLKNIDCL